jgi:hypothetical protein
LDWKRSLARIDSRIYFPPEKRARIKAKLQRRSLRVLVPPNSPWQPRLP